MAKFELCIGRILQHEGGFNNIKNDMGGATNFGISLRFYINNINPNATAEDIANLTQKQAEDIYFKYFWIANKFDQINNQQIANKLMDMAVNMGSPRCIRFVQEACFVGVDGIMGINTLNAINTADSVALINRLIDLQTNHYNKIVEKNESQRDFLNGWLKRAKYDGI